MQHTLLFPLLKNMLRIFPIPTSTAPEKKEAAYAVLV
jgi:hypothetical protein